MIGFLLEWSNIEVDKIDHGGAMLFDLYTCVHVRGEKRSKSG